MSASSRPAPGGFSKPRPRPQTRVPKRKAPPPGPPRPLTPTDGLMPFGGRLLYVVFGLAAVLVIVTSGSGVGTVVADVLYAGVRRVFEANPPISLKQSTPAKDWVVGSTLPVSLTLITADFSKLSCTGEEQFKGYHCAFASETKMWPTKPDALDDHKRDILQPYRTPANELILVGGLWADPHVAMRLHEEPPHSRNQDRLARFVAHCELEFVGVMKNSKVRWAPGGPWLNPDGDHVGAAGGIPVAVPRGCTIQE